MAYNPPNRYPNNVVIPGNMIDASVFNTLKILNMIEKSLSQKGSLLIIYKSDNF